MAHAADLGDPGRAVDAEAGRAREVAAVDRQHRELRRRPPAGTRGGPTRPPTTTSARPAAAAAAAPGRARSETSKSESWRPWTRPSVGRLLPDAEQQVVAERVQVGRVAGDLQLAEHARPVGVGEVERVERVDLAERDDVAHVAEEADGVDALAAAEAADVAALDEPAVAALERRHAALGVGAEADRGRGAQDPVVLGQRELVQEAAGHRAARPVARAVRVRRVEAVDRRQAAAVPALGRDVQARLRRVDGVAAREDRVGVDRRQALGEVDRVDGQHAGAGEHPRAPDRAAADRARRAALAAADAPQRRLRQPAGGARAQLGRAVDRVGERGDDDARAAAGQARVDDVAVEVLACAARASAPGRRRRPR